MQNALESSHGTSRTDGLILAAQEKKVEPGKKVSFMSIWAPEGADLVISGELLCTPAPGAHPGAGPREGLRVTWRCREEFVFPFGRL